MIAEKLEHAPRAIWLAVEQDRAALAQRRHAVVVGAVALRAVEPVEKRRDVEHLGAMLEKIAVDDCALRERGRRGGHAGMVESLHG